MAGENFPGTPKGDSYSVDVTATSQFSPIRDSGVSHTYAISPDPRRVLTEEESRAISSLPAGNALLIVLAGPNEGARFLLSDDVTNVGRHPRSDIFLDDFTVSRKHAQFLRNGTSFSVKDSGSLNGTYVNRELVGECVLHEGDEVQIGKYRLTFYPSRAA